VLRSGETVLISAGGGGVGVAAIQLAKLAGARVLTTVGSQEKAERTRALGADVALIIASRTLLQKCISSPMVKALT
jgi:NADPH:quinone reductase-like Zn-dependent oxidoreductase